jgi:predicted permease
MNPFQLPHRKSELTEELNSHLNLAIADRISRGESAGEARRNALREFGNLPLVADVTRERWGWLGLERFLQDLRYALRTLARDRGFTIVAVLTLALGIGANVVVFSVVNTLILRPPPFPQSQQLVWLAGNKGIGGISDTTYKVDTFQAFQRHNRSFQSVTAYVPFFAISEGKLTGFGQPEPVQGLWAAGDFFQTLGVHPSIGRQFTPNEFVNYDSGGNPAVILSYGFWKQQFHSDPRLIGKSITISNRSYPIVGVLPASFDFGSVFAPGVKVDYFIPISMNSLKDTGHALALVGRLKPGVSVAQAQLEANILFPQLRDSLHLDGVSDYQTVITGLKDHVSGQLRRSLIVLWCAAGLILLVVCVNLSNLLLARASACSKEFALRMALGAGRARLIHQLVTESLVLSVGGAVLGLGFAYVAFRYLAHQGSITLPLLSTVRIDATALAWTLLLAIAIGLLFGVAPGLKIAAGKLQDSLKDSGPHVSGGKNHERMRSILVISEIALACVLLVGAGLLLRSFFQLLDVDLGFRPPHASAIKVDYNDGASALKRSAVLQEMLRRVTAIPGIESAGITDNLPLESSRSWDLYGKGVPHSPGSNQGAFVQIVTPDYLRAMGMTLVEGRDFNWNDTPTSTPVILINQAAAKREWPGKDPIGKLAVNFGSDNHDVQVVGVVADVHQSSVEESPSPEIYVPITQSDPEGANLVIRSALPFGVLSPSVMSTLRSMNPGQPAAEFRPIQTIIDHSTSPRRFFAALVAIFAALGLVLASLGIYGVISYSVTRQTQEIGIRMALGATRERVQLDVIYKTLRMALIGIVLGTIASFAEARAISSMLFGTAPTDPVTFTVMALLLTVVALAAGYIPARRASRTDPISALRNN